MSASHRAAVFGCVTLLALGVLGGCPNAELPPDIGEQNGGTPANNQPVQLQGARVEFPGNGTVASIVADDGTGTIDLLGTDDGQTITITGAVLDIGQGSLQLEFDQAGRVTSLMTTSGALMTFTHNADGTFDYAFERNGVVEYTGTGLVPSNLDTLTTKQMQRAEEVDPGEILEFADKLASGAAMASCREFLGVAEVPNDSPLVDAFKYDSDMLDIALGVSIYIHRNKAFFEELHKLACSGDGRGSAECKRAAELLEGSVIARGLGFSLGMTALGNIGKQILERATNPTPRQLCGLEEIPVEVHCTGTLGSPFSDGGFESGYIGPPGSELASWAATSGQPALHPTKINGQPVTLPPGLRLEGDYYLELPPGASITRTFETFPETGYRVSYNISVWVAPRPLVRTTITYGVDAGGNPLTRIWEREESVYVAPIGSSQKRWGAECPVCTLEIRNLADRSIFLDDVTVDIPSERRR